MGSVTRLMRHGDGTTQRRTTQSLECGRGEGANEALTHDARHGVTALHALQEHALQRVGKQAVALGGVAFGTQGERGVERGPPVVVKSLFAGIDDALALVEESHILGIAASARDGPPTQLDVYVDVTRFQNEIEGWGNRVECDESDLRTVGLTRKCGVAIGKILGDAWHGLAIGVVHDVEGGKAVVTRAVGHGESHRVATVRHGVTVIASGSEQQCCRHHRNDM